MDVNEMNARIVAELRGRVERSRKRLDEITADLLNYPETEPAPAGVPMKGALIREHADELEKFTLARFTLSNMGYR